MRKGYACINLSLGKDTRVNRGMIKRTFLNKGLDYVSNLAYDNILDMQKIIEWNVQNNITAYRMSSDMFPWFTEYEFEQLPNFDKIHKKLQEIGKYCRENNHRVSFHPGPFNCLASPTDTVVEKTISELDKHSQIMNYLGFKANHNTKINIHVGGAYGDKQKTAVRFCQNFAKLNEDTQKRLTIENDDKESLYTINNLYTLIHKKINIPLVFDYHHHYIHNDGMSEKDALDMAVSTWQVQPTVHFSSSKKLFENIENDNKIKIQAHADFIYKKVNTYGHDLCIIFEAKAKDLSVLKYNESYEISE